MAFVPTGWYSREAEFSQQTYRLKKCSILEHAHTRLNPMTGQSVLVCPHRMLRPWSGQVEPEQPTFVPEFDASNPLCPGAVRSNGEVTSYIICDFVITTLS